MAAATAYTAGFAFARAAPPYPVPFSSRLCRGAPSSPSLATVGAFELDCAVCPVAIKYNRIFADAFWNSPQYIKPGETPIEFAERVRDMISVRAGLKKVPWDGYLKYFRPSPKLTERKYVEYNLTYVAHNNLLL